MLNVGATDGRLAIQNLFATTSMIREQVFIQQFSHFLLMLELIASPIVSKNDSVII